MRILSDVDTHANSEPGPPICPKDMVPMDERGDGARCNDSFKRDISQGAAELTRLAA